MKRTEQFHVSVVDKMIMEIYVVKWRWHHTFTETMEGHAVNDSPHVICFNLFNEPKIMHINYASLPLPNHQRSIRSSQSLMHVAEISFSPTHSHFDKLKVAWVCICLFYKAELKAYKEFWNSVNSTYLDATCHHTFGVVYNYDQRYPCRMVNDRICRACRVNKFMSGGRDQKTMFSLHSGSL